MQFFLLDRPQVEARPGLSRHDIPTYHGEVLVGEQTVFLEAYDDGRLDNLADRFTALAGTNIPPAHPRTKVILRTPRHVLALTWRWRMPRGVSDADVERLDCPAEGAHRSGDLDDDSPAGPTRSNTRAGRQGR